MNRRQRPQALLIDLDESLVDAALAFVREARAADIPVALALASAESGPDETLAAEFDAVVTPVGPGTHRPSRAYFEAACVALRVAPAHCLYVGAADRDVGGARAAGLAALRWNGPDDVAYLRAALGLYRD